MAITKKALEIRKQKKMLRSELVEMNERMIKAACKIPDSVINGGYRSVIGWRDGAKKILSGASLRIGSQNTSIEKLEKLRQDKAQQIRILEGNKEWINKQPNLKPQQPSTTT